MPETLAATFDYATATIVVLVFMWMIGYIGACLRSTAAWKLYQKKVHESGDIDAAIRAHNQIIRTNTWKWLVLAITQEIRKSWSEHSGSGISTYRYIIGTPQTHEIITQKDDRKGQASPMSETTNPECTNCVHYGENVRKVVTESAWERITELRGATAEKCCHPTSLPADPLDASSTYAHADEHRRNDCGAEGVFHSPQDPARQLRRRNILVKAVASEPGRDTAEDAAQTTLTVEIEGRPTTVPALMEREEREKFGPMAGQRLNARVADTPNGAPRIVDWRQGPTQA